MVRECRSEVSQQKMNFFNFVHSKKNIYFVQLITLSTFFYMVFVSELPNPKFGLEFGSSRIRNFGFGRPLLRQTF